MMMPQALPGKTPLGVSFQGVRRLGRDAASRVIEFMEDACSVASQVHLGGVLRRAIMLTSSGEGTFTHQATDLLNRLESSLRTSEQPLDLTAMTLFLAEPEDLGSFSELLARRLPNHQPIITPVCQPPCGGAALAVEAWAMGRLGVKKVHHSPRCLSVTYDGMRWIYLGGMVSDGRGKRVYDQTLEVLTEAEKELASGGGLFSQVMRTWFYLGGITDPDADSERYKEMNRARADFYQGVNFCGELQTLARPNAFFPASTGIGMEGTGLAFSCMALQTKRSDVRIVALENPLQTPAYTYHPKYSPKSPKFARGVAMASGDYATLWVSGTASIVNSESCYPGDVEAQTDQTLDNIERLIGEKNLAAHGLKGAGAKLQDLAKVRVYVKNEEDYRKCQAVIEQRLGAIPVIYALADVCRPELLVEIEGVAFTHYQPH